MNCLLKKTLAEAFGTFVLVFFACGTAIVTASIEGVVNEVATALSFGLVIVAMAYTIGEVSGCHINPAVSLAKLLTKELSLKEFLAYVCSQLVGATIAALTLYGILTAANHTFTIYATNAVIATDAVGVLGSIGIEVILTLVFVYVILVVTSKKENAKIAGLIIGLTLTLVHLLGINLTGTSVNPARSFGPALMSIIFDNTTVALKELYVFFVGPFLGAGLAVLLFNVFHKNQKVE